MKGIIALESVLPSEKKSIHFSYQSLERAKFRDTIPSLSAIQTGGENGRSSNAPPTKVHKTKLLQKLCPCKGEECRDKHGDAFQRKDVHRRQWRFVTHDGIIFSESQRKEDHSTFKQQIWIFRSPMTLWSQTHTRRSTSMNLALLYGYMWWKILRQCYRWEDNAINLVVLIRGRQEELPELRLHGCSYQTESSTIHWILDSQGTPWARTRSGGHHAGSATTIYRRTGRTRCLFPQPRQLGVTLRMKLSQNNLMMRNFPWLPPMWWETTLAEDTKSKKGVIGSQPRGNHNVFTHYPKGPNLWGL